ncbi:MAG: MarR family winged helix-turn-helix transcriptional regulator [Spirochaetales bacterium]|jgi:DNA-binding MarR family transcriptional regulator|nr:MarR family winged helix-turn-helix transcriptional regulator [Spirochaetales bacterium]
MNGKRKTEKCYCTGLRRAAKELTGYYDRMLMPSGITVNQYALLINSSRIAPCSVSKLAAAMRLERTTLVRNMKPLLSAGLLMDSSPDGSRDRQLMLTRAGRACLRTAMPLWEKAQMKIKKYMGGRKFKSFMETVSLLEKISSSLQS